MKIVVIPISMVPIISIISLIALNLQENQQQIWHQTYANIVPVTAHYNLIATLLIICFSFAFHRVINMIFKCLLVKACGKFVIIT